MNTNENANNNRPHLQELGDSNYKIADGQEDIIGWDVKDGRGNNLGEVDELIFDDTTLKVRYLVLDIDSDDDVDLEDRKVLIPIGMAQLDPEEDDVILPNISLEQIRSLPEYDEDNLNSDYERRNYNSFTGNEGMATGSDRDQDFYNSDHFNDENLYRNRNSDRRNRTDENQEGEITIPVIEENLNVGKREVERGGIRITSRVVETPVEKNINLREEHVTVERTSVDRAASQDDFDNLQDQDLEIHERAEVPVVNKEARVVEEVRVKKEVNEHEEEISDTVHKTEVNVEDLNENDRRNRDNS